MAYKDKWQMFKEYVETHDTITYDYVIDLTYKSVKLIFKRYTKGTGVQFQHIGKGTYLILK